jgi:hypothetical protein
MPPNSAADKVIDVPNVGVVSFPGAMSDDEVSQAIQGHFAASAPAAAQAHQELANTPMKTSAVPALVRGTTSALPSVGAVGAGIVAAPTTPLGSAFSAAFGAGAGEQARLIANHILFGDTEPSPVSKRGLGSTAVQAGTAAVTAGALHYFTAPKLAPIPAGNPVQTPEDEWRAINDAIGVKPSQVRMAKGTDDIADAYNMPGRSVSAKTGITSDEFKTMTPFEQAAKISPAWRDAGKQVTKMADQATQNGTTFDVGTSVHKVIANMDSPQVATRAYKVLTDTAKEVGMAEGVTDWSKATPNQALALRRAMWDNLPSGYRSQIYGALSRDLKTAVPDIVPADQAYSELSAAIEATKSSAQRFAVTAPPSAELPSPAPPSLAMRAGQVALKRGVPAAATYAAGRYGATIYHTLRDLVGGAP